MFYILSSVHPLTAREYSEESRSEIGSITDAIKETYGAEKKERKVRSQHVFVEESNGL